MLQAYKFNNGTAIQVGGLNASGSKKIVDGTARVFDSNNDRIVEIYNGTPNTAYIKFQVGSAPVGKAESAQDGVTMVFSKSVSRPFILPANTYLLTNHDILVVPLNKEK